jgi:hypothetical protein
VSISATARKRATSNCGTMTAFWWRRDLADPAARATGGGVPLARASPALGRPTCGGAIASGRAGRRATPFAVYPDPRRRAAALVPGRADSAAEAPPNELPGYLHRHESVVGGAVEGVATTVFVVRVDLAGEARPLTLPLGVAMLAGSRLVAAVGASGRVTHLREGMFLVSVEGCTPEQTVSHAETLRKAMVGTPLVTSAGDLLPVTCSVSFARFLPGDPALAAPSLDALVERAVSEQETQ